MSYETVDEARNDLVARVRAALLVEYAGMNLDGIEVVVEVSPAYWGPGPGTGYWVDVKAGLTDMRWPSLVTVALPWDRWVDERLDEEPKDWVTYMDGSALPAKVEAWKDFACRRIALAAKAALDATYELAFEAI